MLEKTKEERYWDTFNAAVTGFVIAGWGVLNSPECCCKCSQDCITRSS